MEPDTSMRRLVVARLRAGIDPESIVHELSLNFEYMQHALREYVLGVAEAGTAHEAAEAAPPRSFRLAR